MHGVGQVSFLLCMPAGSVASQDLQYFHPDFCLLRELCKIITTPLGQQRKEDGNAEGQCEDARDVLPEQHGRDLLIVVLVKGGNNVHVQSGR